MESKRSGAALICIVAACWGISRAAHADELDDLRRAVDEQQQRIDRLEQERESAVAEPALLAGWDDGFYIGSADGKNKLKIRGYFQTDGRFFFDDDVSQDDQFLIRRARPILEGTLLGWIDFRLMPDFGGGSTRLFDAYANARLLGDKGKALQLRVGEDKVPFSLERLQSGASLLMAERALVGNLVPNRDIGAMIHGAELLGGRLDYQLGVFNGVPDNGVVSTGDLNDGKDVAARVFAHPLRGAGLAPLEGLGIGVAGTWGDQGRSTGLPVFRTSGQNTFFSYLTGARPDGNRYRVSPQLYWSWGPAGLLAEYVLSRQDVQNGAAATTLTHHAWQATLSYLLTGEQASFKGVSPERAFAPGSWGPGAWEIVGRLHQLDVDDDAFPVFANPARSATSAFAWALGLNWYWNKWIKLVVDYERTTFDGGAASGDRETENALLTRFQLAF